MTGFKINWYLQNTNYTKFDEKSPDDLDSINSDSSFLDEGLVKMVELARQAREKNTELQKFINKVVEEKLLKSSFFNFSSNCNGQLSQNDRMYVFAEIFTELDDSSTGTVIESDIKAGFIIYSTVVFCDFSVQGKFHKFLQILLYGESSRTILKMFVNSIESGKTVETQT